MQNLDLADFSVVKSIKIVLTPCIICTMMQRLESELVEQATFSTPTFSRWSSEHTAGLNIVTAVPEAAENFFQ